MKLPVISRVSCGDMPINLIEIGDYLLAWDESTDTLGWYEVTDTIHHPDAVVIHLTIDGEELETTPEHPFYVEGEGWVNTEGLEVGDDIRKADGETGEVESIAFEETSQEMYNLTVDDAHTFFVGDGRWLAHNVNCDFNTLNPYIPSVVGSQETATYAYNGLGDRLSQNGANYTLDLNSGLTQVLNDGTNQYLYGVGRISQVNTTTLVTDYFLTDALGSVRQLRVIHLTVVRFLQICF